MIDVGSSIDESFSDIHELALTCRFKDCTHTVETGCAILKAVENEVLDEDRYQNYLKLMKESEFYQMSYIEKRKKATEGAKPNRAIPWCLAHSGFRR